ncbi:hypothetical protein [Antarcticirhabdus aurantiaca]|uniref:Uncharacterized protein n=1 Tax=Antarcticirhabdus aurantiaca TaxID=2606717 RepID=A0ACD4NUY6_9HYPH|nr:hypothetical protein [Antarcticirhabdus aurantiaca]WAJ30579.1 hypothetical protein OXU80_10395 [Jeongeuplla avenae]
MRRRLVGLAALWGFAEATLFFLVPDVLLSFAAMRFGLRPVLVACLAAALGATLGGATMMVAAQVAPEAVRSTILALPGIGPQLVEEAGRRFAQEGVLAAFLGSLSGVPYKLYAYAAGAGGEGVLALLLATPLIRLPRFVGATLLAAGARRLLVPRLGEGAALALLAAFWLGFYAWYFSVMAA